MGPVRAGNPDALGDRLTLASYYQKQGRTEDASVLIAEVLAPNPSLSSGLAAHRLHLS